MTCIACLRPDDLRFMALSFGAAPVVLCDSCLRRWRDSYRVTFRPDRPLSWSPPRPVQRTAATQ